MDTPMQTHTFQVKQSDFMQGLKSVSGVIEQSQIMPILSHVLLEIEHNTLRILSSDGAIFLKHVMTLNETYPERFTVAVSCKKLLEICRTIPQDATLECIYKEGWFTIKALSSTLTLSTLPPDSFPQLNFEDDHTTLQLPTDQLKFLLTQTAFSMAQQDVRFFLNGVKLSLTSDGLTTAATDGHRLAMSESQQNIDIDHAMEAIIPRKAVHEMIKLLDQEESLSLKLSKRHLVIESQKISMVTSLLEGQYPEVHQLLPQNDHGISITLPVQKTKQALQQAAILSHEKFRAVELTFSDHKLTLSAHNAHQEKIENAIPIDYDGETVQMAFNISYILDVLQVIEHSDISFTLRLEQNCAYIKEAVSLGTKQFVIMSLTL